MGFYRANFSNPALMPFLGGKYRTQKSFDQFFSQRGSDNPGPQAKHIHIIVLDALVSGIGVMTDPRVDSLDFIGGDACTYPRTADENPARGLP